MSKEKVNKNNKEEKEKEKDKEKEKEKDGRENNALEDKHSKKRLRFKVEFEKSTESLVFAEKSASTFEVTEEDERKLKRKTSSLFILKSYVQNPVQEYIAPVPQFSPCFSKDYDAFDASSHQLLDIVSRSPVSSNADLKLINSVYLRRLDAVKEAIQQGANVNMYKDNQTPLLIAVEIGEFNLVEYFLSISGIDPNTPNLFGETPLLVAVRNGFDGIIRLLLKNNADVNKTDSIGNTPLHVALFQKLPSLAKLLIVFGADIEKADSFGERPIYTSVVKRPHLECLRVLLRAGAKADFIHISGMSLLSRAILNCSPFKILQLLIHSGASVNYQDWYSKKTPLHMAALINDVDITIYLLKYGADPNKTTLYNFTPYDEAVFHRNIEVAEILVKCTRNAKLRKLQTLKLQLGKNK